MCVYCIYIIYRGVRGVMDFALGNGHGDPSSTTGQDCWNFILRLYH